MGRAACKEGAARTKKARERSAWPSLAVDAMPSAGAGAASVAAGAGTARMEQANGRRQQPDPEAEADMAGRRQSWCVTSQPAKGEIVMGASPCPPTPARRQATALVEQTRRVRDHGTKKLPAAMPMSMP